MVTGINLEHEALQFFKFSQFVFSSFHWWGLGCESIVYFCTTWSTIKMHLPKRSRSSGDWVMEFFCLLPGGTLFSCWLYDTRKMFLIHEKKVLTTTFYFTKTKLIFSLFLFTFLPSSPSSFSSFPFVLCEAGSSYASYTGLLPKILLLQSRQCWDHRQGLPHSSEKKKTVLRVKCQNRFLYKGIQYKLRKKKMCFSNWNL